MSVTQTLYLVFYDNIKKHYVCIYIHLIGVYYYFNNLIDKR